MFNKVLKSVLATALGIEGWTAWRCGGIENWRATQSRLSTARQEALRVAHAICSSHLRLRQTIQVQFPKAMFGELSTTASET